MCMYCKYEQAEGTKGSTFSVPLSVPLGPTTATPQGTYIFNCLKQLLLLANFLRGSNFITNQETSVLQHTLFHFLKIALL